MISREQIKKIARQFNRFSTYIEMNNQLTLLLVGKIGVLSSMLVFLKQQKW